ncbi:MAG TPA: sigma-70 family RNA polymerase sigma factor [Chitinophaga sp.]|uniref:RNA polymerase sigma factor n=1 Tax=Chitinophaga sp. TaxID=1869181 RepID=UPI002F950FBF
MSNNCHEREFILRLRSGDINAFDSLYHAYHGLVYANIFKLTRDENATKDILQEVFICLWEKRRMISPEKDVCGWLFVVSYNKSLTWLKRSLRTAAVYARANEQPAESENGYYEAQMQLLKEAIGQLSPQKRKVFELCKIHGKSYDETARELQLSKHTVKEYLSASLACIKEYVRKHPEYHLLYIQLMFTWAACCLS